MTISLVCDKFMLKWTEWECMKKVQHIALELHGSYRELI